MQNKCKFALLTLGLLFTTEFISCQKENYPLINQLPSKKTLISFSWWGNSLRNDYTLEGLQLFEKNNPDIIVEPYYGPWHGYEQQFPDRFYSNHAEDLMMIQYDWLSIYSKDGDGFYDLSKLDKWIELNNLTSEDLSYGYVNGILNAVPVAFNTTVPVWDINLFEEYHLSLPENWDDLFKCAAVFREHNLYTFGTMGINLYLLLIAYIEQTQDKTAFSPDGHFNLNETDVKYMLQLYKKLFDEKVIYPDILTFESEKKAEESNVAGIVCWSHECSRYAERFKRVDHKVQIGNYFIDENAPVSGWYIKPSSMYAINKNSRHPEEAARLLNFLLNDPDMALLQKNDKGIPLSNRALTTLLETKQIDSLEYDSLMKMRFYSKELKRMTPNMENSLLVITFIEHARAYQSGKESLNKAGREIYTAFCTYCNK